MNKQQREFYKLFSEHGSGDAKVIISPQEVLVMLYIATSDLGLTLPKCTYSAFKKIAQLGFYNISHKDIDKLPKLSVDESFAFMEQCQITNINNIAFLYMKNLCDLYRRRVKYYSILKTQSFPNAEQIVPRSLLEYGNCENQLLADWLEWRKWIFDIDNRSAQETGYVFEPILASCLGGESVSASISPVKRIDEKGNPTSNGRQIDCYISESREVYELKMRVTIAASGQGRFSEEMSFPYEAQKAGLIPVLVVFDNNESTLLTKLKSRYLECGGRYYIGEDAWNILKERAGKEMGIFINKYIYPPINSMESLLHSNPHDVTLSKQNSKIVISNNRGKYIVNRE